MYAIRSKLILISFSLLLPPLSISAQKLDAPLFQTDSVELDSSKRWSGNGGVGLDAAAITLINPRVNDGGSRINLGGIFNFNLNYQGKRILWSNRGNLQISTTQEEGNDWTKATDALMWNSQLGFRVWKKWYAAAMVDVQTQLLKTYDGAYISQNEKPRMLVSRFFAPANLKIAPGLLWKPKPSFSLMLSAISNKNVIVANPTLAALVDTSEGQPLFGNILGKEWTSKFGAEVRADLNLKFADDKLLLNSVLDLYSNYLQKPENIAVEWLTSLDILVTKNFSVNLRSDWFYDHSVLVKIGGFDDDLGRRISIRNTIFLKYTAVF
jgi:hypothetical protein